MELTGGVSTGTAGPLGRCASDFLCSKCSILKGTVNSGSLETSRIMFLQKQSAASLHKPQEVSPNGL